MANCCLCGTKIAGFGADKFKLTETEILCHQCAPRFRQLQEATTYDEYTSYKKYLVEKIVNSSNPYGANIVKEAIEKIDAEKNEWLDSERRKAELLQRQNEERQQNLIRQQEWLKKQKAEFLLTTGYNFDGYTIVKYLNITHGEVVLGTGFMSELSASVNDLMGTTSSTLEGKLSKAKKIAQERLIANCLNEGANAVIGVDFDITTLHNNMIVVSANGTAVFIEKIE